MDNNDLKERDFEAYIEHWLTTEGGYVKGNQVTYDKERAIDLQTPCLKRLKYEPDANKFKVWLQQLRDWRNEQSHQAPIATEEEYDAAIHIVTALYLYVTAYNIKWIQPKMEAKFISLNSESESIGMAAEPGPGDPQP